MKRFLIQLQPVDFGAIAKRGCFVYCYLRADGTPYYVGIARLANRPVRRLKADTKPPRDHSRIRVMRSGLSWDQACHWERVYIARYGRKDNGTGFLRNRTDGGDGVIGYSHTEETKRLIGEMARGQKRSDATCRRISEGLRGRRLSAEAKEKIRLANLGKTYPQAVREKVSRALTGRPCSQATRARLRESNLGQRRSQDSRQKMSDAAKARLANPDFKSAAIAPLQAATAVKLAAYAKKYGVTEASYVSLDPKQRHLLACRFGRGKRGAELLAGIDGLEGAS